MAVARRVHIVWDWNGTLLDDFDITVRAANAACGALGAGPFDPETYRCSFTRPVRLFYERLLARPMTDAEWDTIADAYHTHYLRFLPEARLRDGAEQVLASLAEAGVTHSLLSMTVHDELMDVVGTLGIAESFLAVEGVRRQARAETKHQALERHIAELQRRHAEPLRADDVLLIGDTLDDHDAATAFGAACVLLADGSYDPEHARRLGLPLASSLGAAAERGLQLVSGSASASV